MADLSITISNTVGIYGPADANQWAEYNWGAFTWATSNDLLTRVEKLVVNTLANSTANVFGVAHFLSESLVLDTSISSALSFFISNSLAVLSGPSSEVLTDGAGYVYNFPDRATNAEDRDETDWAESSDELTTWTPGGDPSTDWN